MHLRDLWTDRVELKRRHVHPYRECDLLIVLAAVSGHTSGYLTGLLDVILDVSDPHGVSLIEDLAYSREHKNGGIIDVECWSKVGRYSKERIQTTLVARPETIVLLLADVNCDDPQVTKTLQQAFTPLANVTLINITCMSRSFPSRLCPAVFHISPVGGWHGPQGSPGGDEVELMAFLRRRCTCGFKNGGSLTSDKPKNRPTSQASSDRESTSTRDTKEYVPCRAETRQSEMNEKAFRKYRELKSQ